MSLKRQLLQAAGKQNETGSLTSLSLSTTDHQPLPSYSLPALTTASVPYTYPSTLSYYGNSSYTSSYMYSSNYASLFGKSESTNQVTSAYGFTLTTTTSATRGLDYGYNYQPSIASTATTITTTSLLPTSMSTKLVTMDTLNQQQRDHTTEATLVLPELDNTALSQGPPKPTQSHGQ